MHVLFVQHVAFERPFMIEDYVREQGARWESVCLSSGDVLPSEVPDLVVLMGGPMSVHDEGLYPWLKEEKVFIRRCVEAGKRLIGVCLGAQLLAEALGGEVRKAKGKEIGWFPVYVTPEASGHPWVEGIPPSLMAFHWHGEEVTLPPGALHLFYNHHTEVQGFLYEDRILGLQFHLEGTPETGEALLAACASECAGEGPSVQDPQTIREGFSRYLTQTRRVLFHLLARLIPYGQ
ncbi:glutamine amidotransferase class-I [Spirochaeta thermophila DSM 6578]|uniref:Glutamine amidotransferase class-I n=1 Tax=Winmispira thermophila (strain ATCC 700085 / DSM 6578 / Z-1203) TaxID=869211 RepID=G0GAC1_WINT7|nr:glutamine amidotransferase class-I [Spirochaeta thermophila DSM 6578]